MKTIDFTLFFFNGVTKYTLNSSINYKNKNVQLITDKKFLDQILEMRDKIFRITKRILVSHQEAEDAKQEGMIIQLREIEQYDFNQIATILELPEGTVWVYLSRARKKLRKQFLEIQNHGI